MNKGATKKVLMGILCKMFNHRFFLACEGCENVRCMRCGEWFSTEDAYGEWR